MDCQKGGAFYHIPRQGVSAQHAGGVKDTGFLPTIIFLVSFCLYLLFGLDQGGGHQGGGQGGGHYLERSRVSIQLQNFEAGEGQAVVCKELN